MMNDKLFAAEFAHELETEVASTRKCLERIPFNLFNWKPHERSMELGYLTLLVAEIPLWITHIITKPEIDFATFEHAQPKSTEELLAHFHENVQGAVETLRNIKEGVLAEPFYLKSKGEVLLSSTKKEQVESTINHMVHHRGQLTVYMRLNNIMVPSIYGPSADDRNFSSE